ncbi:MAG: hypothetical protein HQL87_05250 [Magnetococcales bacterium]|nr:hypothetical protein [Magnetococcales bacterium]
MTMTDDNPAAARPAPRRRWLKRIITYPAMVLAALLVLFEELVWDKVTDLVGWLAHMRWVARLEAWIVTLGPYPTLALFAIPILTLLPLKVLALYLIAQGQVGLGIVVILVAKTTGTAISARLFVIAKPKLMTFATFVVVYHRVVRFKQWAHAVLAGWPVLSALRRAMAVLRAWGQRLRASGRNQVWSRIRAARRYFKGAS